MKLTDEDIKIDDIEGSCRLLLYIISQIKSDAGKLETEMNAGNYEEVKVMASDIGERLLSAGYYSFRAERKIREAMEKRKKIDILEIEEYADTARDWARGLSSEGICEVIEVFSDIIKITAKYTKKKEGAKSV